MIGAIGDREHVQRLELEGAPGVEKVDADPQAVQARLLADPPRRAERARDRRAQDRRRALRADRRAVHGRVARAGDDDRRRSSRAPARRSTAAAPTSRAPRPTPSTGSARRACRLLAEAKAETGMPIVTELMDVRDLEPVLEVADVIQVGARNMQNYTLLTELGRAGRPVLLKRGLSATLEEWLNASEYILKEGNEAVMLCERGIRTFETAYRFTLDLTAVPVLKELTHLPVIVDPSHAAGRRDARRAAVARGRRGRRRRDHRRGAPEAGRGDLRRPAAARRGRLPGVRREGRSGGRASPASASPRFRRRTERRRRSCASRSSASGLIGGSIGLAARERLGATRDRLEPQPRDARARAASCGALDRAGDSLADAVARRRGRVRRARPSACCRTVVARRARGGARRTAS